MRTLNIPTYRRKFDELYAKGKTNKEIAEAIGVHECLVGQLCKELGLTPHGGTGRGGYRVNSTTRAGKKSTPGKAVG